MSTITKLIISYKNQSKIYLNMYLNKLEENWFWEEQSSSVLDRLFHSLENNYFDQKKLKWPIISLHYKVEIATKIPVCLKHF